MTTICNLGIFGTCCVFLLGCTCEQDSCHGLVPGGTYRITLHESAPTGREYKYPGRRRGRGASGVFGRICPTREEQSQPRSRRGVARVTGFWDAHAPRGGLPSEWPSPSQRTRQAARFALDPQALIVRHAGPALLFGGEQAEPVLEPKRTSDGGVCRFRQSRELQLNDMKPEPFGGHGSSCFTSARTGSAT